MSDLLRLLRLAGRRLWSAPLFSLIVICTLVLCIAPSTVIFSALHALILKPLPFPAPSELVTVFNIAERSGGQQVVSSTTQYLDFKEQADLFSGFATTRLESTTLDDAGRSIRVPLQKVSANFFELLGAPPVAGRFFLNGEDAAGKDRVLVLSKRFWQARFGGDPSVLGRVIQIGGQSCQIVGIAPDSLESLSQETALYQPYAAATSRFDPQTRYRGDLALYARLKPGVSRERGLEQLNALEKNFYHDRASPALRALVSSAGYRLALEPLRPGGAVGPRQALWLLQGGALFVLLIGCLNVVNLFLARTNSKRSELATRLALGANWRSLVADSLAEAVLLAGAAVALGVSGTFAVLQLFNHYLPVLVPGAPPVSVDSTVLLATVGAALLVALIVGLLPLYLVSRLGLAIGQRGSTAGTHTRGVSGWLVCAQVAFAVILLVGTTLLLRSFTKVMDNHPGYDAGQLVVAQVVLPGTYQTPADRLAAQKSILDALQSIPGVQNAALSLRTVLGNERPVPFARREEQPGGEAQPLIHIVAVSPGFFDTMGLSLLSGRNFDEGDAFPKNPVAIVDRAFADRYYPGQSVENREIYLNWGFPLGVDAWPQIVGVVSRANLTGLDSRDDLPIVYVPTVGFPVRSFEVLLRSPRNSADLIRDTQVRLAALDPAIQMTKARTLDDTLTQLLLPRRGITQLAGLFSAIALLLAAIGLYGMLAFDVSQRTREIGIRSAIGATRFQIIGLILRDGMIKTAIGLLAGVTGAFLLAGYLGSLLFGVGSADATAYILVTALLTLVSVIACWFPAHRASCVDPIIALKAE